MAVYKVRMTVLAMIAAHDPIQAEAIAVEMATDTNLTVLNVEEPDRITPPYVSGSVESDIYP